ncbi:hypothetical protein F5890DRAFT_1480717 [Lentinula detonsa]|uniref:Uncharacterized protein n=1 Tax=Lentinula detonsa TaxID=2804962 RepID=A0AA38UYS5_9AGAR|nr:hypothetical protein F5890DRAFT_1480717 [Lentinula detonsa]
MFSPRSWYFLICFVLVRCRCESAALESKDVKSYQGESLTVPAKRNDLIDVTQLIRRATSDSESTIFAILTGCIAGILALLVLFVFVYTRLKRRQIMDVEKGVDSVDSKWSPPRPPSKPSLKASTRSPSNTNSWAFLQLRFARRKLWASLAKESPQSPQQAYPYPSPHPDSATDSQLYLSMASLPFQDVPPLLKPKAAVVPDQYSVARPRMSPTHREKDMPFGILLPVDGGVISVPASVTYETDGDEINPRSNRWPQLPPASATAPDSTASTGGTGNAVVAQTIIANKQKPRQGHCPTESISRSPTRSRKGSLLSGPPLTVDQCTITSPTEEGSVDVASYYATAYLESSRNLEEELDRMLSEQRMTDSKEET